MQSCGKGQYGSGVWDTILYMKSVLRIISVTLAVCACGYSQTPGSSKLEFEAAAIKTAAPQVGHFNFRAPASPTGGPGTADPGLFRCTGCNLFFLISKAFELEKYQFPGQGSLPQIVVDLSAKVPEGTTPEQFPVMLQNLLKDRFNLAYHFDKKPMQGYELVVAKGGHKLKDSKGPTTPIAAEAGGAHQGGSGNWHGAGNEGRELTRPGLMVFNGQGKYRGENQSTADLARMISNQLAKAVDDHTGLQGKYDISLSWADDGAHAASHGGSTAPAGGWSGAHGEGGGAGQGGSVGGAGGPSLIGAVQAQLGLRLEKKLATASIFIVDRVDKSPTDN